MESALAAAVKRHGFAFLIDLHGHAHPIARLELGYGLGAPQLNVDDAAFDRSGVIGISTLRDLHLARGIGAAELLRGPRSLGALLSERGQRAVPSPAEPGPGDMSAAKRPGPLPRSTCCSGSLQTPQCGMWCEPIDTATFFGSRKTS